MPALDLCMTRVTSCASAGLHTPEAGWSCLYHETEPHVPRPEKARTEAGSVNLILETPDAIKGDPHYAELRRLEDVLRCVLKKASNNALRQQRDFDDDRKLVVDSSMTRLLAALHRLIVGLSNLHNMKFVPCECAGLPIHNK